jgi:hypothetical protein
LEDVTLPRFGLVFFNHLIGEYDSFTGRAEQQKEAYQRAGQLKEIYVGNTRQLTWGDLAALECLVLQLRSGPELRERFWTLQRRYREVAPKGFYPENDLDRTQIADLDETELRARTEVIACEFFRLCMLAICREDIRAKASRRVWMTMIGFTGVFFLALLLARFIPFVAGLNELRTVSAVLFAGATGGFISAQRRIQGVTDHGESLVGIIELSSLSNIWGKFMAPSRRCDLCSSSVRNVCRRLDQRTSLP